MKLHTIPIRMNPLPKRKRKKIPVRRSAKAKHTNSTRRRSARRVRSTKREARVDHRYLVQGTAYDVRKDKLVHFYLRAGGKWAHGCKRAQRFNTAKAAEQAMRLHAKKRPTYLLSAQIVAA
jgi:hypothetical protein